VDSKFPPKFAELANVKKGRIYQYHGGIGAVLSLRRY
jgi:hypothetical protein